MYNIIVIFICCSQIQKTSSTSTGLMIDLSLILISNKLQIHTLKLHILRHASRYVKKLRNPETLYL
jgi:hypothetical protein